MSSFHEKYYSNNKNSHKQNIVSFYLVKQTTVKYPNCEYVCTKMIKFGPGRRMFQANIIYINK